MNLLRHLWISFQNAVKSWLAHRRRHGIYLTPKDKQFHSTFLEKHLGFRGPKGATPLFFPCEIGYQCPICGQRGDHLYFSEYNYCLYCDFCNIDIPSILCLPIQTKRDIEHSYTIFVEMINHARNQPYFTWKLGKWLCTYEDTPNGPLCTCYVRISHGENESTLALAIPWKHEVPTHIMFRETQKEVILVNRKLRRDGFTLKEVV
jgi:hypothetical protein